MSLQQGGGSIISDGLIYYFDANNERSYNGSGVILYDLSKYEKRAELLNGLAWDSKSFTFDGSNDEILIKDEELKNIQVPMTIAGWFMDNINNQSFVQSIFSQYSSYTLGNFVKRVYIFNRSVCYQSSSSVSPFAQNFAMGVTFSRDTWNFFSVSVSGTIVSPSITLSLNDSYQTFSATTFSSPNSIDIRMGNGLLAGGERLVGKVSSLVVYNRALSQNETNYIYTITKSKFGR